MVQNKETDENKLTEHLFRVEYGKIVAVISKFLGIDNLKMAEDIAQQTFYKAVKFWQHEGIPPNPSAWLYVTAKNECLNRLKRIKQQRNYKATLKQTYTDSVHDQNLDFSEHVISDDQLRLMFVCCHHSISKEAQLSLILKILCGFSISEIASAFFTSSETINKRLVRARKKLKDNNLSTHLKESLGDLVPTIIQAIYLLFNEGYSPSNKNISIRRDLCFEAIRLAEILNSNSKILDKGSCNALLSLMYLNASRFAARLNESNEAIELKNQDRQLWNQELINKGIFYLNKGIESETVSIYHILASISANHCIATDYEKTNWSEILSLYDALLNITDSPVIRLNRSVALSKVRGNYKSIEELKKLRSELQNHHLYHSTIATFYIEENDYKEAEMHVLKAIAVAKNGRDINFLKRMLANIVPI